MRNWPRADARGQLFLFSFNLELVVQVEEAPDVVVAGLASAVRGDVNIAVMRPERSKVIRFISRKLNQAGTVGIHDEDVKIAFLLVGLEHDFLAIRTPFRIASTFLFRYRELLRVSAVNIHNPDIPRIARFIL